MKTILFCESSEARDLLSMFILFADDMDQKPLARRLNVAKNKLGINQLIGNDRLALEFNAYYLRNLFGTSVWLNADNDDERESLINMVFELARVTSCIWKLIELDDYDFNLIVDNYITFYLREFKLTDTFITNI